MKVNKVIPGLIVLFILLIGVSAYKVTPQPLPQPTLLPTLDPTPTSTLSPTEVIETPAIEATLIPIETIAPAANHEDAPLRFTFPTPQPPTTSLWRPPLYDTPWALGPHDHFFFTRPIAADEINWPLADYRYGGIFFNTDIVHTGVDITAKRGTPVIAAGPGQVMFAGYGLYLGNNDREDPYGQAVTIRHDFGYQNRQLYTVYAHMDRIDVVTGQRVETGTPLGIVGDTGMTTGPHLHFEVRIENDSFYSTRNPELWLSPPQGWGVLAGKALNTNGSLLTRQEVTVISLATSQKWTVATYGDQAVNADDYYQENVVLSDLPAGSYEIVIDYQERRIKTRVEITPGAVTYFFFRGNYGFSDDPSIDDELDTWLRSVEEM